MNVLTFNLLTALGVALIGAGVALVSVPAALVTVGVLVLVLTHLLAFKAGVR